MRRKTYRVTYERDAGGWWVASVRGVPGCHTQGRTISQARERIREALGLFVAGADRAHLLDDVRLPADLRRLLAAQQTARARAKQQQARARAATRQTALLLTKGLHLSVRDAAELLDLSHQRVQQLLAS
jgi:predicted RNase H-like HicB family nuclease